TGGGCGKNPRPQLGGATGGRKGTVISNISDMILPGFFGFGVVMFRLNRLATHCTLLLNAMILAYRYRSVRYSLIQVSVF
ncbi:MAG TPA: hypothetical protein DG754_05495, partial [Bacteroidales bacterium]|nr:hypothetical protein [Bacteroidales bacterium]